MNHDLFAGPLRIRTDVSVASRVPPCSGGIGLSRVSFPDSVAPPSAVAGHLWAALKPEITYVRPTFLQDNVVAEVIAERVEGARAFFRTVLRRGHEVLSEISSCWCCLDAATKRPARLARDIVGRFLTPGS